MAAPIADAPEIKIENDGGENNEQNQENIQHNFAGRGRGRGGGPGGFRGGPNRRPGGPFVSILLSNLSVIFDIFKKK